MNVPRFDIAQNSPGLCEPDAPQSPKRNVKWKATKCEQCAWRTTRGVCYASRIRHHIAGKNETLIQLIFAL